MLKLILLMITAMLIAAFPKNEGSVYNTLKSLKNKYFNPPGCVACFKSIDKHLLKDIIALKSDCTKAQEKFNEFVDESTATSYYFHICKENDKKEFADRMKTLERNGEKVLKAFAKCTKTTLTYPQKNAIKELRETFENQREECGDKTHLENELISFWKSLPEVNTGFELLMGLQSAISQSSTSDQLHLEDKKTKIST